MQWRFKNKATNDLLHCFIGKKKKFEQSKSPPWLAISCCACNLHHSVAAPPRLRLSTLQSQPASQTSGFQSHAQTRHLKLLWNRQWYWRFPCHVGDAQQTRHCQWRFAKSPMQFTWKTTPPRKNFENDPIWGNIL